SNPAPLAASNPLVGTHLLYSCQRRDILTCQGACAMETDLRYPIGKFHRPGALTDDQREEFIAVIEHTPTRVRAAVKGLTEQQLNAPYRPGGWTVRQVVHHIPDSHMNAYVRFKL